MLSTAEGDTAFRKITSPANLLFSAEGRPCCYFEAVCCSVLISQYHQHIKTFPGLILPSLTSLKPAYEALGCPLRTDLRPGKKYRLAATVSACLRRNSVNFYFFFFLILTAFFLTYSLDLTSHSHSASLQTG